RVTGREERIVLSPDDQRRQLRGQIEPVGGADTLATQVDDAPHGVQERLAGVGLLERHETAPYLLEAGTRPPPEAPQRVRDRADASPSRHAEPGQHPFSSRECRRPEQRMQLATE